MTDNTKFNLDSNLKSPNTKTKITDKPLVGRIGKEIGTGQNAKDSFIWMTIRWSFIAASTLSLIVTIKLLFLTSEFNVQMLNSLADIWSIFTPIITLALGYAFGKGQ
ncbi:hypothetical protein [Photobacterium phosphoreum]|uniref:hypothetical protein n=1 Tax=Photobacterium phosphoreum TaxID=659 RepID=UPI00242FA541|nr:hypothetical protein [Photobacterium phosphoreum]